MSTSTPKYLAVAPMMDWTDRHCRYFHRQLSRSALLYTEMVTPDAVILGDRRRVLGFDAVEHPVALQLGSSDPARLAEAAAIGADFGYDEINLNVGCPSDRVQSGAFGACLMRTPGLVAECVAAMKGRVVVPVTVKCRLGVDEQDPEEALDALADAVLAADADGLWVHARKAWLDGLSPKENRTVPPLDYDRVLRLKARLPDVFVGINGGIADLDTAFALLDGADGAMLGRAAYQNPGLLTEVDRRLGLAESDADPFGAAEAMVPYAQARMGEGARLSSITRHMIGLFHGMPGARQWRRILSTEAVKPDARPELILRALEPVRLAAMDRAA